MKLNFYKPFNFFNKLVKIKESISTSYLDVVKEMKLIINVFNFNKFNINSFFSIDFMISRYKFIYIAPFYIFYIFSKIVNYEYFFDYTSYSKKYPYFKNKLLNIYWPFKSSYWYFFTPFDFKEFPRKISKKFYVNSTYPKEIVNVVFHWDRDKRRSLEKKSEFNSYTYETIVYKALRDDILSHDDERASAGLHYIGAFAYWLSYERDFDTFYYIITFDGVINWKSFGQPTKDIKFFYVYFKYLEFKLFKLNVKKFKFSKHDFMSFALEKTNFSFFYKQRYNKKKTPGYKFEEGLWLLNFFEKKFTKLTKTYGKKSFFYDFSGKAFWLFNYIEQDYIKKNYNNLFLSTHINYFYHVYNYLMFFAIPFFTIIWHFFTIMFEIMIFFLYIILFFVSDFIMFFIQFFIPVRFIYRIFMFICLGVMFYIFYLLYKINLKPIIDLHNVDDFTEFKYWLIERPKIRVIKEEVIFIFNYWIYFVNMLAFCMPYFYGLNGNFDFFINYSKVAPGLDIFRRLSDYYSKIFGPKFISKKDLYSFEISKARFIDFNLFSKVKEIYYKFIVRFINFFNFVLILRDILFIKSIVYINIIFL